MEGGTCGSGLQRSGFYAAQWANMMGKAEDGEDEVARLTRERDTMRAELVTERSRSQLLSNYSGW